MWTLAPWLLCNSRSKPENHSVIPKWRVESVSSKPSESVMGFIGTNETERVLLPGKSDALKARCGLYVIPGGTHWWQAFSVLNWIGWELGKDSLNKVLLQTAKGRWYTIEVKVLDFGVQPTLNMTFKIVFIIYFIFNYVYLWVALCTCTGVCRGWMNRILGPGVSGSCKLPVKCAGKQMCVLGRTIHILNHLDISPARIWIYYTKSAHLLTVNIYIYIYICPSINT